MNQADGINCAKGQTLRDTPKLSYLDGSSQSKFILAQLQSHLAVLQQLQDRLSRLTGQKLKVEAAGKSGGLNLPRTRSDVLHAQPRPPELSEKVRRFSSSGNLQPVNSFPRCSVPSKCPT